jgi:hypothetical protein
MMDLPSSRLTAPEELVVVVRSVVIATLALAVVLLAGCTTTHIRTARAAEGLERSADAFADRICYEPNDSCPTDQYLPAAREFAVQAYEFRQTLDSAGDQEVVSAFKRLWRRYHTLRDEVYRLGDRQLQADLKPITQGFGDVQRQVRTGYSYADTALYANGGYTFDPYYN